MVAMLIECKVQLVRGHTTKAIVNAISKMA